MVSNIIAFHKYIQELCDDNPELKERYDGELLTYDNACKALCKPRTGRNPNPPTDLSSLKAFLAAGKRARKRKKNEREGRELQKRVEGLAKELKAMIKQNTAPR